MSTRLSIINTSARTGTLELNENIKIDQNEILMSV